MKSRIALVGLLLVSLSTLASTPDWSITPGTLCSENDSDYSGNNYPEQIARCKRNVTQEMKIEIANEYGGIPEKEWENYEFDHLLPLCAGGSNSLKNLWPEPIDDAHEKDKLENDICRKMKAGDLTQAQAVQKVRDWFSLRQSIPKF